MLSLKTKYPADTVEYSNGRVVCGTYNYDNGKRHGTLDLYDTDLVLLKQIETDAILDTKWNNSLICTASSDGIQVFDADLNLLSKVSTGLCLSIDCQAQLTASSMMDGSVEIYDDLKHLQTIKPHYSEVWTCHLGSLLYSGSDQGKLSCFDLTSNREICKHDFDAGVCSTIEKENYLYVGSYTDRIDVFDRRNWKVIHSIDVGGGVWRMKFNENKLAVAAMYAGLMVYENHNLVHHFTDHESMVYGVTWMPDDSLVSCSFYDCSIRKRFL